MPHAVGLDPAIKAFMLVSPSNPADVYGTLADRVPDVDERGGGVDRT